MANDLIQFGEIKQTMSSLEIAKLTGKPHNDVLKAIRAMEPAWEKVNGGKFSRVEYKDAKGEMRPCFELTKTECLYVATKFNDEARAILVMRWEELEQKQRAQMLQLPDFTDPAEAAMAWAKEYREKKVLAIENQSLQKEIVRLEQDNSNLAAEEYAMTFGVCGLASIAFEWHRRGYQQSPEEIGQIALELLTKPLL